MTIWTTITLIYWAAETTKAEIKCINKVVENVTPEFRDSLLEKVPTDPKRTFQLYTVIQIGINLRYDVTINVNTPDGITNGAGCLVKRIATSQDSKAHGCYGCLGTV